MSQNNAQDENIKEKDLENINKDPIITPEVSKIATLRKANRDLKKELDKTIELADANHAYNIQLDKELNKAIEINTQKTTILNEVVRTISDALTAMETLLNLTRNALSNKLNPPKIPNAIRKDTE
jgi:hypothetical protein